MNSTDNDYIISLNNTIVNLYKYVLPVFYVLANAGNLLSALIFSKKSWKKNVCVFYFNIYLLVNTCYINSIILAILLNTGYQINLQNSSVILCKLHFYISFLLCTLSPTILILASIDRLLISSQNIDTRLYSSKRLAYFSISLSTFFWIIFNFHTLIKVNIQHIDSSYFVCYYDPSKVYRDFVSGSLMTINILFSVTMIILSLFAFKNVHRIRFIPRQQRNQFRSMTKKDFQLLRCLFAQDIVYLIFGTMISVYYVYSTITNDQRRTPMEVAINHFLNSLFIFIFYTSYSTSFFVFIGISKAFRQELKRLIFKIFDKNLTPIREEEDRQEHVAREIVELNVVVSTIVVQT